MQRQIDYPQAGNWQHFENYLVPLSALPENPEDWAVAYTMHRDSRLLERSNAYVINQEMQRFLSEDPNQIRTWTDNHWAVGWITGYIIRVGSTAYKKYCEMLDQKEQHIVLDEDHYMKIEYEQTIQNIQEQISFIFDEDCGVAAEEVQRWLDEEVPWELESLDDMGGCPSEESIVKAVAALRENKIEE